MNGELARALGELQAEVAGAREDIKEMKVDLHPRVRSLETTRSRVQGYGGALAGMITVVGIWLGYRDYG
jgi:hypothetical protein